MLAETSSRQRSFKITPRRNVGIVRAAIASLEAAHQEDAWIELNYFSGRALVTLNPHCKTECSHPALNGDRVKVLENKSLLRIYIKQVQPNGLNGYGTFEHNNSGIVTVRFSMQPKPTVIGSQYRKGQIDELVFK